MTPCNFDFFSHMPQELLVNIIIEILPTMHDNPSFPHGYILAHRRPVLLESYDNAVLTHYDLDVLSALASMSKAMYRAVRQIRKRGWVLLLRSTTMLANLQPFENTKTVFFTLSAVTTGMPPLAPAFLGRKAKLPTTLKRFYLFQSKPLDSYSNWHWASSASEGRDKSYVAAIPADYDHARRCHLGLCTVSARAYQFMRTSPWDITALFEELARKPALEVVFIESICSIECTVPVYLPACRMFIAGRIASCLDNIALNPEVIEKYQVATTGDGSDLQKRGWFTKECLQLTDYQVHAE